MGEEIIRLNESDLRRIIRESIEALRKWFRGSKVVNRDGSPMLLYHAYESNGNGGSYDSGMVYYTTDREYAEEFGDVVDSGYLKLTHPYVTEDGLLRGKDGKVIIDEDGYEMSVGYLDMLSEDELSYFVENYDGIISEGGYMVVSFIGGNFHRMGSEQR